MGNYTMTVDAFNAARRRAHPDLRAGQPDDWTRWMDAEGIDRRHVYRFDLDADTRTITVYRYARHPDVGGIACDETGQPLRSGPTTHPITALPPGWVLEALVPSDQEGSG